MPRGIYVRKNGSGLANAHRVNGQRLKLSQRMDAIASGIASEEAARIKERSNDVSFENFIREAHSAFESKDSNSARASMLSRLYEAVESDL